MLSCDTFQPFLQQYGLIRTFLFDLWSQISDIIVSMYNPCTLSVSHLQCGGLALPVPDNYQGHILSMNDTSQDGNDRHWKSVGSFQQLTYWNHDSEPTTGDIMWRCWDWLRVAEAVRGRTLFILVTKTISYTIPDFILFPWNRYLQIIYRNQDISKHQYWKQPWNKSTKWIDCIAMECFALLFMLLFV